MKYMLILLALAGSMRCGSTNEKPNSLASSVTITAAEDSFMIEQYFSLDDMDPNLQAQEWYAFLRLLNAPEDKFWIKFRVHLYTVSKDSGKKSKAKVDCEGNHNDLHDCFISHKQINPKQQNLLVNIVFNQGISLDIALELHNVRKIKIGEEFTLKRADPSFTPLIRMDLSEVDKAFDYLWVQLGEVVEVDEYNNAMEFFVSFSEAPPKVTRNDASSHSYWDNKDIALFSILQLQEVTFLTFLIGITDHNTYLITSRLIAKDNRLQPIPLDKTLYQVAEGQKSYILELPERPSSVYYMMRININSFFEFNVTHVKVNGGPVFNQSQLLQFLIEEDSTFSPGEKDIWFNSTVRKLQFTFVLSSLSLYTMEMIRIDMNLIILPQKFMWNDKLDPNQTEFIYMVIDTKNGEETINLEVETALLNKSYAITFSSCVEKEVSDCQKIATGNNSAEKAIGLTQINPIHNVNKGVNFYSFNDLRITKQQIQPSLYRSIVVAQISSLPGSQPLYYEIRWHIVNAVQTIKENQLVKGKINPEQVRIFSFTVFDATNIAFARVHFLHGTSSTHFLGAQQIFNFELIDSAKDIKGLVHAFDGSVTFTGLTNRTTYYVYVFGQVKDYFELTLTYGSNSDGKLEHAVSFLTLGEHSSNQLVLQPREILFIEVRSSVDCLLTISHAQPLKICILPQDKAPKSYNDIAQSHYCEIFNSVNHFYAYTYKKTDKYYMGIQNQNKGAVSLLLETDNTIIECIPATLGRTRYLSLAATDFANQTTVDLCVRYEIPEKGEIQILVELNNPKLQGIALPTITIGKKQRIIMSTNTLLIAADDVESYCEQSYEECELMVIIEKNQQNRIEQDFIGVTASYTSQPLPLKDGLAHHSTIKPREHKNFKYAVYSLQPVVATLQSLLYEDIHFYAKVITPNEKFVYPTKEEYQSNSTSVFTAHSLGYFYPAVLTIPQLYLINKCQKHSCYVLYTVYSNDNSTFGSDFLIQVTQTFSTLSGGVRLEKYLEKESKAYFSYKNTQENSSLLFFTSSTTKDCLKIDVFAGNAGINSTNALFSGIQDVLIPNSKVGWYTVSVTAVQTCYFTIQASSSKKEVRELVPGFANHFSLGEGEKRYYLLHNSDFEHIKMVTSISQKSSGQLTLQAMPVADESLGDFIKFINGEDLGKRSKLTYVWSGINHLTLRSSEPKFCKNCYLCIEAQASNKMEGYLTVPSGSSHSLFLGSYISYDILLQKESFSWLMGSDGGEYNIGVGILAGEVKLEMQGSLGKVFTSQTIKYDKTNSSKNSVVINNYTLDKWEYATIKITALDNADYSIYSTRKFGNDLPDGQRSGFLEVGRPNYIYLLDTTPMCFTGILSETDHNEFIITTYSEQAFQVLNKSVSVTFTIDGKDGQLEKEWTPNALLLDVAPAKGRFQICFSLSERGKAFSGSMVYLGNLNYFPQNSVLHIKKAANLTFMSDGRGVIEVDECASRSVITLNSDHKDVKNMASKINSRRVPNNLIFFSHNGPVYLHVDSADYVALSWKNAHRNSFNGFGYEYYSPASFIVSYNAASQDFSVKVKPIEESADTDPKSLPALLSVTYHVYIANEELDLYNAMNCQKGNFMYWMRRLNSSEVKSVVTVRLNNVADLKTRFRGKEYVLIMVKAEATMHWPINNFTEKYRFYYPYQEVLLSQFHSDQLTEDSQQGSSSSSSFTIVFIVVAVIVTAFVTVLAMRWLKRKYWRSHFVTELDEPRSEVDSSHQGTELATKVQSSNYAPPNPTHQ